MRRTSLLLVGMTLLGGCADPAPTSTTLPPPSVPSLSSAAENRDLATLRAATARFHRYDVAKNAGYTFLFMDMCMEDQSSARLGGMGNHYVNPALLDGSVDVGNPEALLYEPGPNGQLKLVGVEYVIPKDKWTSAEPPMLFGQQFTLNAFDLWALHVWASKNNPSGLYAAWNPLVSCANAAP